MKHGEADKPVSSAWCERLDFYLLTGVLGGLLLAVMGVQALFLSVLGILLLCLLGWPLLLCDLKRKTLSVLEASDPTAGKLCFPGPRLPWVLAAGLLLTLLFVQATGAVAAVLSTLVCFLSGEQNPAIPFGQLRPLYLPLGALLGFCLWWVSDRAGGRHRAR